MLWIRFFLSVCNDPFQLYVSDNKLFDWLKKKDYLADGLTITGNNSKQGISKCGKRTFDEKLYKVAMLPLRFQFKNIFKEGTLLADSLDLIK